VTNIARVADFINRLKRQLWSRKTQPTGVLIISAGGLGDTILFSTVASRFAEMARPGEKITVLLRKDSAKTAFCLPSSLSVKTVDFKKFASVFLYRLGILSELYEAHFRLVIHTDFLRHPFLDESMASAAQTDTVAMIARSWPKYQSQLHRNRRLYSRLFDSGAERRDKVERWTDFANWLSGSATPPPLMHLHNLQSRFAPKLNVGCRREIILQPFSAVNAKQLNPECFIKLVNALPQDISFRVTGLASDLQKDIKYRQLIEKQNVTFDSSTFEDICPRLVSAELVLSVDTAMMHLAVAIGAPTLCLASAAYVGEIIPYADSIRPKNVSFLFENMDCAGCLGDCVYELDDGSYPCVASLSPDRVVSAVLKCLKLS